VYILECQDRFYYTGMTWSISNRINQHIRGFGSKFTRKHGVKKLKFVAEFDDFEEARETERKFKNFSRKKKEGLFNCDVELMNRE